MYLTIVVMITNRGRFLPSSHQGGGNNFLGGLFSLRSSPGKKKSPKGRQFAPNRGGPPLFVIATGKRKISMESGGGGGDSKKQTTNRGESPFPIALVHEKRYFSLLSPICGEKLYLILRQIFERSSFEKNDPRRHRKVNRMSLAYSSSKNRLKRVEKNSGLTWLGCPRAELQIGECDAKTKLIP